MKILKKISKASKEFVLKLFDALFPRCQKYIGYGQYITTKQISIIRYLWSRIR